MIIFNNTITDSEMEGMTEFVFKFGLSQGKGLIQDLQVKNSNIAGILLGKANNLTIENMRFTNVTANLEAK